MEEGRLCIVYVGQQGDGSTFNCLINGARTETECSFFVNIYIYSEAEKRLVNCYWFSSILEMLG